MGCYLPKPVTEKEIENEELVLFGKNFTSISEIFLTVVDPNKGRLYFDRKADFAQNAIFV